MKTLIKKVYVKELQVYKVEISDEMAQTFQNDEDAFWDTAEELDWEFSHDKVDEDEEYEIQ